MKKIVIISASVRLGRRSHRVALFFKDYIQKNEIAQVAIADLAEYNFPIFEERLKFTPAPPEILIKWSQSIKEADGIIIVTPEYNGGYPASLKNAIDVLYEEWYHKPIAISTVSDGIFGGTQVITSLQFSLWKMKAWVVPAMFPVASVGDSYDEDGKPAKPEQTEKRAQSFLQELMWAINLS